MARNYERDLVNQIKNKQSEIIMQDVKVINKPIPDTDIKGAMDPRAKKGMGMMGTLMRFVPKRFLKMEMNLESVEKMRKMFNNVDSTSFVTGVKETPFEIKMDDGYMMPAMKFESDHTIEDAPILYFIHGGGFFAGSYKVVSEALRYIVQKSGIIAVGIDYRLAPENPFPRGHQDVYQGLQYVYANAEELGGSKDKIFVAGDSAGGNLTAYCTNQTIKDDSNMIKGQIMLYPTVNMGGIEDEYTKFSIDKFDIYSKHKHLLMPMIEMFASATTSLGDLLGTEDIMNVDLTPYMDVSAKSPATMITCGEHDALVIESLAYAKKLNDLGVDTTFTLYRGMGHAYIDQMGNYPQSEDCADDMIDFILKNS